MLTKGDKVALMTSGGDAPGMNSALRGAARVGAELGLEVLGVEEGYAGLMDGRVTKVDVRELDEASRRGGTVLGTARSREFATPAGKARAEKTIESLGISALIVIGGNGSLAGARTLLGTPTRGGGRLAVAGIPASIDNDLACTSMSIGTDTAMNTIVEACDRIFDTASAHRRTFIVEVMGRDMGYLAMTAGIAAGADAVLVRETGKDDDAYVEQVVRTMVHSYRDPTAKHRVLVIKAEGVKIDTATLKQRVDERIKSAMPDVVVDTRVTVLGHVVRGGSPTAFDRLLGARLANTALRELAGGNTDFMAGWIGPGVPGAASKHDPYVVCTALPTVLDETDKLHRGESALAAWRKKVYAEVESILER